MSARRTSFQLCSAVAKQLFHVYFHLGVTSFKLCSSPLFLCKIIWSFSKYLLGDATRQSSKTPLAGTTSNRNRSSRLSPVPMLPNRCCKPAQRPPQLGTGLSVSSGHDQAAHACTYVRMYICPPVLLWM